MLRLGVNNPLTVNFKNFLHRVDSVGIRPLLQHLIRNGVQLKQTENNIRTHFLLNFKQKQIKKALHDLQYAQATSLRLFKTRAEM